MPFRVLIVDSDPGARAAIERVVCSAGNMVTAVGEFHEAHERLVYAPPDLLITAVKLGSHNGLHLVVRSRAERPSMPAIVVHSVYDPVLANEATNAGAPFVTLPIDEERFAAQVDALLSRTAPPASVLADRRWPRKRVRVGARIGASSAAVVDVSYGGLRLEITTVDHPLSRLARIDIPAVGSLPLHPVWARGGGAVGRWWCGAEIDPADQHASDVWRRFVDSMS